MQAIYQLRITLKNVKPPIWRQLLVPAEFRLDQLHELIQVTMGWQNSHLHEFAEEHPVTKDERTFTQAEAVAAPGEEYPQCVGGKRACPPEDCGGPWRYEGMLESLADSEDEEHEMFMDWIGGDFDAERLDLVEVQGVIRASKW